LFNGLLNGEEENPVIKGQMASPVMNDQGELQFFFREDAGRVSFAVHGMVSGDREAQNLLQCDGICSPIAKKDRTNRIHLLWAVSRYENSDVYSGNLINSRLSEHSLLFRERGKEGISILLIFVLTEPITYGLFGSFIQSLKIC